MSDHLRTPAEAVQRAEALGHRMTVDTPAIGTVTHRWTCLRCGKAVLDHQGVIYGSAIEGTCPPADTLGEVSIK